MMNPTKRIIYNTLVQYLRSILTMGLALFSTRYVLSALDISDFGIYTVIAGLVSMLGFITNAMIVTTQRFISYNMSIGDEHIKNIFANSVFLHIIFAFLISAILFALKDFFIWHFLNIPSGREVIAGQVYIISITILFLTIVSSPYKALYIAHENIIYLSFVEVLDAILKFALALYLIKTDADKLIFYCISILLIQCFNFLALITYALKFYKECILVIKIKYLRKQYIQQLLSFAGWSTYGTGSVAARNQGVSIVFNHFCGTTINAAYGIAMQLYGAIAFVSTSILNAMNPQIMKAEGNKEHNKMFDLALKESLYSSTLITIVAIPLCVEMPNILNMWLKSIPENTSIFCIFIILSLVFDQITYGLHTAIQAIGKIGLYSIIIYTPKLITPLIIYVMLLNSYSVFNCMCLFVMIELIMALVRIPYCILYCGLKFSSFLSVVVKPLSMISVFIVCVSVSLHSILTFNYSFLINIVITGLFGVFSIWQFALNASDRKRFIYLFHKKTMQD